MRVAALLFVVSVFPALAATEWLKVTSANFEMYTTAGDKDARRTLEYFEQVRDFFMRVKSQQVTTRLPVTIVAFRNHKEYKPYAARETSAAYYVGDEQRDYIVLGGVGAEHYPTAVHEYMHLLVRHSGLELPPWLNEGIAEVYSTMKPYGGKILLGSVPEGRGFVLAQQKWIPLDRLLAIRRDSPEFDEKNRVGALYAQSWLLTHMLLLHDAYSKQFGRFAADVSKSGGEPLGPLQRVYGKTLMDLDSDVRAYYRSSSLKGMLFDVKLQKMDISPGRPATELETGLTLAKLTALLQRRDDAHARYAELAKQYPDNWEIHEAIAHLHWQSNDRARAKESFRRAVDLKPTSWKTYWDYARFAQGEEGSIDALRSALRLNGNLHEARLMLGHELYRARQFKEAFEVLATIKHVTPDRAASFFLVRAFSAVQIGRKDDAKTSAEMALRYATEARDISAANSLLEHLNRPARVAQAPADDDAPTTASAAPPTLGAARPMEIRRAEQYSEVRGVLQEVECLGREARVRVLSGNTILRLLIRDPDKVLLKNSDESTVNFTCGPQQGTRVIVEYLPKEDSRFRTVGDILTLEFTVRSKKP